MCACLQLILCKVLQTEVLCCHLLLRFKHHSNKNTTTVFSFAMFYMWNFLILVTRPHVHIEMDVLHKNIIFREFWSSLISHRFNIQCFRK